jgi:hypothetical protein
MRATHIIRCLAIVLLALAGLAPAPALAWEDYEGGNRPYVYRFPIDESFQDPYLSELCGFPVQLSIQGGATGRFTFNRGTGLQVDTFNLHLRHTLTNLETGESEMAVEVYHDRSAWEVYPGGEYTGRVTVYQNYHYQITAPGVGPVEVSAGRTVLEVIADPVTFEWLEWEVVFESGPHHHDHELLCAALS